MDPVTAAGIGLSITSLVLQVFAGCVQGRLHIFALNPRADNDDTGYQLFVEAQGMPESYQYLRVRLRMEQTRLLHWGEKVGLLEEVMETPSKILQLHRNLIIDILLEVQALFKSCVKIEGKYDSLVPSKPRVMEESEDVFDRRFPRGSKARLSKVLGILEKVPQAPARLQWATVKQKEFKDLIEKLIGYNNFFEMLLDRTAIDGLQAMQHETHMIMLQLNSKVDELKQISLAMQVKTQSPSPFAQGAIPRGFTFTIDQGHENASFARLAEFKVQQTLLENGPSTLERPPVNKEDIAFTDHAMPRSEAVYQGKDIWIEYKEYTLEHPQNQCQNWSQTIEDRVKKLAALLSLQDKPEQFRAPHCIGYFDDRDKQPYRYGFMYEKPHGTPKGTKPVSLLDLIVQAKMPSLTKRITLAHAIAQCLMYLHSVNWLHKSFRSSSVVFFTPPGRDPVYTSPIVSGFDYARPDLPGEMTEKPKTLTTHDIYRHPSILSQPNLRSAKAHDIYSLGIVLVEIAYWQSIDKVVKLPEDSRAASSKIKKVKGTILAEEFLDTIEQKAGEMYRQVVQRCLTWGEEFGVPPEADVKEKNPDVEANMQQLFFRDVMGKLENMKL